MYLSDIMHYLNPDKDVIRSRHQGSYPPLCAVNDLCLTLWVYMLVHWSMVIYMYGHTEYLSVVCLKFLAHRSSYHVIFICNNLLLLTTCRFEMFPVDLE